MPEAVSESAAWRKVAAELWSSHTSLTLHVAHDVLQPLNLGLDLLESLLSASCDYHLAASLNKLQQGLVSAV